ncbi:hypothetical protein BC834DRAFT_814874 [Gloeopeniophorella convolvens]|nr:hypothetical protein BC834DRAFT_814874 [Gloeopeniophorella convolvens]
MATDIVALRAELKSFERDFKAQHGHAPSVDDIKKAGFADRYKLYKKLSKPGNAAPSLHANSIGPPSTPPRSVPRKSEAPSSIVPKSRAVKTETASVSNPFSPLKKKQAAQTSPSGPDAFPNPFTTPRKAKPALFSSPKTLSPDPFPLIQPLADAARPPREPVPNNTVTRARKRLRGEPVSPSPVKEKRQRIIQDALPFPKLGAFTAEDSDEDDQETAEQVDSFVADSPLKARPKGGAFKLLFDEGASDVIALDGRARSKKPKTSVNNGLFKTKSQRARSMSRSSGSEAPPDNHRKPEMKPVQGSSVKDSTKARTSKRRYIGGQLFGKNDLFDSADPTEPPPSGSKQAIRPGHTGNAQSGAGAKRSLADTESDVPETLHPDHGPVLLPPSPPPAGSTSTYTGKGKGKATASSRKRPKVSEDRSDEDEEEGADARVKIREWSWQRREIGRATDTLEEDFDPVLGLGAHDRQSSPGPTSDGAPGEFEVSLPDDLRRMLAISPSKAHTAHDANVVRGVLYGERTANYDGRKGGDIWDVGEIGEESDSHAEDDWEGEPVPWETGEL